MREMPEQLPKEHISLRDAAKVFALTGAHCGG